MGCGLWPVGVSVEIVGKFVLFILRDYAAIAYKGFRKQS